MIGQRFEFRSSGPVGLAVAVAVLVTGVLVAAPAMAQDDEGGVATVEIRFWAFSSNPEFFAYQTTNHLDEQVFFVGQAGAAEPVYNEAATEDRSPRDILISREIRDAYGWNSSGNPGTASPSGHWQLILTESGQNLSVVVTHGRETNPIGSIARMMDPGGREMAEYELKEVYWSDDESVAVIILHQELGGAWPLAVDTAHGFPVPPRPEPPPPEAPPPTPPPTQ